MIIIIIIIMSLHHTIRLVSIDDSSEYFFKEISQVISLIFLFFSSLFFLSYIFLNPRKNLHRCIVVRIIWAITLDYDEVIERKKEMGVHLVFRRAFARASKRVLKHSRLLSNVYNTYIHSTYLIFENCA